MDYYDYRDIIEDTHFKFLVSQGFDIIWPTEPEGA